MELIPSDPCHSDLVGHLSLSEVKRFLVPEVLVLSSHDVKSPIFINILLSRTWRSRSF